MNEKYHFSAKNKKIIIVITDGKVENFFKYFQKSNKNNKFKIVEESNIDHLFIYVKSKNNSESIIQEKIKFEYINILEKSLKEQIDANNQKNNGNISRINDLKQLNFSEIYRNFYQKIIYSKQYDTLHQYIKTIISKYINNFGKEYINYLKTVIDKEKVINLFMKHFKFDLKDKKNILESMQKDYNKNKSKIIPNVSILELVTTKLRFKNYKNNDLKILNYEGQHFDLEKDEKYSFFFPNIISSWKLKKNENSETILIYDTNENDNNAYLIHFFESKEFINYTFIFNEKIKQKSQMFKIKNVIYFSNEDELKNAVINISKKNKFRQFIYSKLSNKYSYFDKILKNRIIVEDNIELPNNYLEQFLKKINQTISIYTNNDISKYNDVFFGDNIIKIINDNNNHQDSFINEMSFQIEEILSNFFKKNAKLTPNLREFFINKFNNHKDYLTTIYYKYYERIYTHFMKKMFKKKILNEFVKLNEEK